ncbi:hypothetical protein CC80DRAFT_193590 [Byssothecium circinans]|uniref:Uncharacterized protein n=1 Tax=Byssothecium circinans TaxID=147558 RepID=A0A6A5TG22_9PLEO|nr:hypothetical protein CC80DRAFT_193590 [Byssothecium circinans]
MATIMSQQGIELPPSSRQDIVSALLNEYGSFGEDDASLYSMYSPAPISKELPPPPPPKTPERERKYSNDTAMPYGGRLSMRFQLRVDEPASPDSPDGSRSSLDSQPRRINYRSISRDSKPPSLKLLASNGSTAKVPPTPALASEIASPVTSSRAPRGEENKLLPPPPPEKSSRRRQQQTVMGNEFSAERPPRKDSLQSQEKGNAGNATEPVKRKPLPMKFTSLLDLKNGPRGGKNGPMPVPRARNQSMDQSRTETDEDRPRTAIQIKNGDGLEQSGNDLTKSRSNEVPQKDIPSVPVTNRLPPTPVADEIVAPAPPSKKPFLGMGLPSNPRAKHMKGKSSTGFEWTGGSKIVPSPLPAPAPNTLTPGPTPSPKKTEQVQQTTAASSTDVPQGGESRRPFSFEPAVQTPPDQEAKPAFPVSPVDASANPDANVTSPFPPRSTSRLPAAFAGLPSQQPHADSPTSSDPFASPVAPVTPENDKQPETTSNVSTPTSPVFTPLTMQPIPTAAAPLTEKHLNCYTKHRHYVWSKNDCHIMACMVCKSHQRERQWACTWCYLRICLDCAKELKDVEGRDVRTLLERKGIDVEDAIRVEEPRGRERVRSMEIYGDRTRSEGPKRVDSGAGNPSVVVWKADEESFGDEGYGNEHDFS